MNRLEFEELELQVLQSGQPLNSYLRQVGVSYSTYHYWHKKCSNDKANVKQELAPISFKQPATGLSSEEQAGKVWPCCFRTGFVPTSAAGLRIY